MGGISRGNNTLTFVLRECVMTGWLMMLQHTEHYSGWAARYPLVARAVHEKQLYEDIIYLFGGKVLPHP